MSRTIPASHYLRELERARYDYIKTGENSRLGRKVHLEKLRVYEDAVLAYADYIRRQRKATQKRKASRERV